MAFIKSVNLALVASCFLLLNIFKCHCLLDFDRTYMKGYKSSPDDSHDVVFVVKVSGLDDLEKTLLERSTPGSPYFRQWLSSEEVGEIIRNDTSIEAVTSWLSDNDVNITTTSFYSHHIHASAPIAVWEHLLNAEFHEYRHIDDHRKLIHRSNSYSIPSHMSDNIAHIFNVDQFPIEIKQNKHTSPKHIRRSLQSSTRGTPVTISFLNSLYGITSNKASTSVTQAVLQTTVGADDLAQEFSQIDLTTFQKKYTLPLQSAVAIGRPATTNCTSDNCGEANLDIQFMMGIAQGARSIVWFSADDSFGDPFISILNDVANLKSNDSNKPTSISISYGQSEFHTTSGQLDHFNLLAMTLGLQGITIAVASGDTGVTLGLACTVDSSKNNPNAPASWKGSSTWSGKGYFPSYPATSPYVVSVGATMGPSNNQAEVAAATASSTSSSIAFFNGKSLITSGGGFSTYYPRPAYQDDVVTSYLNAGKFSSGYNPEGRGYPDVALIGTNYAVIVNGQTVYTDGTSASAPVFGGLITLVNSILVAKGQPTVGFINPMLYAYPNLFNDITSGSNNCGNPISLLPLFVYCCDAGFKAVKGWDAVTGLGSIQFNNLMKLLSMPPVTNSPSKVPTRSPTTTPTISPTVTPTRQPTLSPTSSPTKSPTMIPTTTPTLHPTSSPTELPTIHPTELPTVIPSMLPTVEITLPSIMDTITNTNMTNSTTTTTITIITDIANSTHHIIPELPLNVSLSVNKTQSISL